MQFISDEEYDKYYEELTELVEPLREYYLIDKIKAYSVYVWTKTEELEDSENVFDIYSDEILFWTKNTDIIEGAKPIIEKIQEQLKKNPLAEKAEG